jgi:hypothetical protein
MHICKWIPPGILVPETNIRETCNISETKKREKCTSADGYNQSETKNREN